MERFTATIAFSFFFRTPRSAPHFTRYQRSNQPAGRTMESMGGQAACHPILSCPQGKNASIVEDSARVRVWGSPWDLERAPRKFGVVGCETSSRNQETPLTVSALSLPQFTQMHSKIFLTFTKKPTKYISHNPSLSIQKSTWMEARSCQLNVPKVSWTLGHSLTTCLAFKITINRPHPHICQTSSFRFVSCFIKDFGMFDLRNRICFLLPSI